jgi:hypothetical protein
VTTQLEAPLEVAKSLLEPSLKTFQEGLCIARTLLSACHRVLDLDYADDMCLLPHKFVHMQDKINDLQQESIKAGLKINIGKAK